MFERPSQLSENVRLMVNPQIRPLKVPATMKILNGQNSMGSPARSSMGIVPITSHRAFRTLDHERGFLQRTRKRQ